MSEKIELIEGERKGINTMFILFFLSWGLILLPYFYIALVSWVSLGIIGFVMYKIIDKLFERSEQ